MPESTQAAHADLLRIWGHRERETCGDCARFVERDWRKWFKDRPSSEAHTDICEQAEKGKDPTIPVACPGWDATWQACGKFEAKR